ncbi:MAG: ABC transporter substrate-binding protein [Bdellovibrionota bacterium]
MKDNLNKIILACLLYSWPAFAQNSLQSASFKVGLVYPKTGPLATYADSQAKAVKLGLEEFRSDHPELAVQIAVVVADDKSLASEGEKAADRLIEQQKINMMIGSFSNIVNYSVLESLKKSATPLLLTRTAPDSLLSNEQVFTMVPSFKWYGRMLGFYAAQSLKKKRLAIITHPGDAISLEMKDGFTEAFTKAGGFIVGTWSANQKDVWKDVTMTEPDAYFIPAAFGENESLIDRVMATESDVLSSQRFLRKTGSAVVYKALGFTPLDPHQGVKDFVSLYQKKYGQPPDETAAAAYESIRIILQAFFLSLSVKDKPPLETIRTRDLGGIYGIGRFTKDRVFMRPIPITRTVKDIEEFKGRIQPE